MIWKGRPRAALRYFIDNPKTGLFGVLTIPPYINEMDATLSICQPAKTAFATVITLTALAIFPVLDSRADTLLPQAGANVQNNAGQLRALENRIQRQQFQQQQQQYRAQDRAVPLNRPQPQVPVMKPGCQIRIYGNTTIRDCR